MSDKSVPVIHALKLDEHKWANLNKVYDFTDFNPDRSFAVFECGDGSHFLINYLQHPLVDDMGDYTSIERLADECLGVRRLKLHGRSYPFPPSSADAPVKRNWFPSPYFNRQALALITYYDVLVGRYTVTPYRLARPNTQPPC